jgi:hypothetical protein
MNGAELVRLVTNALFLVVFGDRLEVRTSPALHFHLEEPQR